MPNIRCEAIIPKKLVVDRKRLEKAVENALDLVAENVRVDFEVTTYTWKTKPTFVIATKRGERRVYTGNLIYKFVSGGTKPHVIKPKKSKYLVFFGNGFRPKTRVNYIGSNKGHAANRNKQFRKYVIHPGVESRNFEKVIAKKWRKQFPIIMQRSINQEANHE
jgi:hypothetical protein